MASALLGLDEERALLCGGQEGVLREGRPLYTSLGLGDQRTGLPVRVVKVGILLDPTK